MGEYLSGPGTAAAEPLGTRWCPVPFPAGNTFPGFLTLTSEGTGQESAGREVSPGGPADTALARKADQQRSHGVLSRVTTPQ